MCHRYLFIIHRVVNQVAKGFENSVQNLRPSEWICNVMSNFVIVVFSLRRMFTNKIHKTYYHISLLREHPWPCVYLLHINLKSKVAEIYTSILKKSEQKKFSQKVFSYLIAILVNCKAQKKIAESSWLGYIQIKIVLSLDLLLDTFFFSARE